MARNKSHRREQPRDPAAAICRIAMNTATTALATVYASTPSRADPAMPSQDKVLREVQRLFNEEAGQPPESTMVMMTADLFRAVMRRIYRLGLHRLANPEDN